MYLFYRPINRVAIRKKEINYIFDDDSQILFFLYLFIVFRLFQDQLINIKRNK